MGRARRFLAHAARNAFNDQAAPGVLAPTVGYGASYGTRPDRIRMSFASDRSIITPIYMRMAIDFASIDVRHVRLDDQKRYIEDTQRREEAAAVRTSSDTKGERKSLGDIS